MDIKQLIEEQKKTQEIYKRLEKDGTFEKFFANTPEKTPSGWISPSTIPWNYDDMKRSCEVLFGGHMLNMADALGYAKYYLNYVDNFYKSHMDQWAGYKAECEKHNCAKGWDWTGMYTNPDCSDFFEKYEKEHGIKDSLYQQAKAIREKKK